jgi:deoxycytidine triphosphate deaminase
MKKVRIKSLDDFEELPEGEWIEVEGGDLEIELVEEVDAKLLISEEEVKIPVNEAVFVKIKDKKISIVPETN